MSPSIFAVHFETSPKSLSAPTAKPCQRPGWALVGIPDAKRDHPLVLSRKLALTPNELANPPKPKRLGWSAFRSRETLRAMINRSKS